MPAIKPLHLAITLALVNISFSAHGQNNAQSGEDDAQTLDQVVVTGTRATDRTVSESLSPIDIITPEALEAALSEQQASAKLGENA